MLALLLLPLSLAAAPPADPHEALCAELRRAHADVATVAALAPGGRPSETCHFEQVVWQSDRWKWVLAGMATAGVSMLAFPKGWNSGHYETIVDELLPLEMGLLSLRAELASALLVAGADVEAKLSWGRSPLMLALELGRPNEAGEVADPTFSLARTLLVHGASAAALDGQLWASTALWLVSSPMADELRAAGLPVDLRDNMGNTVLFDAVEAGDERILRQLLAAGADPTRGSPSPLERALAQERLDLADLLVAAGVDPKGKLSSGRTLLHAAAQQGRLSALDWGLAHGLGIDDADSAGETPLASVVCKGDAARVEALLARGARPDPAVVIAVGCENLPVTALLLDRLDAPRRAAILPVALRVAVEEGARAELALLLSRGASLQPGPEGWQEGGPLFWAVRHRRWAMVEELVARGASLEQRDEGGRTALGRVLEYGDLEGADALLRIGAPLAEGDRIARAVAAYGSIEALAWLFRHGVPLDRPDARGSTPLAAAVQHRNDRVVLWLVAQGAEVDRRTPTGATLLVESVGQDLSPARDALLAAGADPNAQDAAGHSALSLALARRDEQTVAALLRAGAWPDRPDGAGDLPLKLALVHGCAFEALVEAGAGRAFGAERPLPMPLGSTWAVEVLRDKGIPFVFAFSLEEAVAAGELEATQLLLADGAVLWPEHLLLAVRSGQLDTLPWMLERLGPPTRAERRALLREARRAGQRAELRRMLSEQASALPPLAPGEDGR